MNIIGIGTDIVQISRIEHALKNNGNRFAERILHKNEIEIFMQKEQHATSYLAKRFAAKEALSKALGSGIAQGVSFTEIETRNDACGKPELTLHGKTLQKAKEKHFSHIFLSLSDEQEYAVAYVILTGK